MRLTAATSTPRLYMHLYFCALFKIIVDYPYFQTLFKGQKLRGHLRRTIFGI